MTTDFLSKVLPDSMDSPHMRYAGREALSLAWMDARNRTLQRFTHLHQALQARGESLLPSARFNPPDWQLGYIAWFGEWWISRNMQRHRGRHGQSLHSRLASIEAHADAVWHPLAHSRMGRWSLDLPPLEDIKAYLLSTLETSLELLTLAEESDEGLYVYRLALSLEDWHGECFARMAQHWGLDLPDAPPWPAMPQREPIWMPATSWNPGHPDSGFAMAQERGVHPVQVPEFEIDAQPVSWGQFQEFVLDGGYEDPRWWHPQGWAWLQRMQMQPEGRGAPAHVQQLGRSLGAVVQTRFGQDRRCLAHQPVVHASWFEADAFARWAGRRLQTEEEWEVAAHSAIRRGFTWGQVWEWCSHRFELYPGYTEDPGQEHVQRWVKDPGEALARRVQRGASCLSTGRWHHPKQRWAAWPDDDTSFVGFRTCAV